MPRIKSISRTTSGQPWGCATALVVGLFGFFMVVGSGIGYFLCARPLYRAYQARAWTPTDCEVISSRVVHGEGTSRPDIVYRYEVGGRQYTANRYNFIPDLNTDSTVPEVVASHPPGTRFECYVDPGNPSRAVINRTPTLWYYLGLPFFVVFAVIPGVVGHAMLFFSRRDRTAERAALAGAQVRGVDDGRFPHAPGAGDAAPIVVKPSSSPRSRLITATLACLFANGIGGVITYFEYRLFVQGDPIVWLMAAVVLVPQMLGVGLLAAVPYRLLALANPRPIIALSRGSAPLGGSVSFTWEWSGAAHRVTGLQVTLRGCEEASYRQGTDTQTDTHAFFSETLIDATHPASIPRGSGTIRIPGDSMHTFTAEHNKVIWTLHVTGAIARWPDIDEDFVITVRPA